MGKRYPNVAAGTPVGKKKIVLAFCPGHMPKDSSTLFFSCQSKSLVYSTEAYIYKYEQTKEESSLQAYPSVHPITSIVLANRDETITKQQLSGVHYPTENRLKFLTLANRLVQSDSQRTLCVPHLSEVQYLLLQRNVIQMIK